MKDAIEGKVMNGGMEARRIKGERNENGIIVGEGGAIEEGQWIGRERRGRRKEDERWKYREKTCGRKVERRKENERRERMKQKGGE